MVRRFLKVLRSATSLGKLQATSSRPAAGDLVSVLFQMQLIPPADAHRLLGDFANFLLDRALVSWRGTFSFEKDAPPPPGAFPLGSRWASTRTLYQTC